MLKQFSPPTKRIFPPAKIILAPAEVIFLNKNCNFDNLLSFYFMNEVVKKRVEIFSRFVCCHQCIFEVFDGCCPKKKLCKECFIRFVNTFAKVGLKSDQQEKMGGTPSHSKEMNFDGSVPVFP